MGRGRPITDRSNYLLPEAQTVLTEAARTAARRMRGQEFGDYYSIGWLTIIRKVDKTKMEKLGRTYLFANCLQAMRTYWAKEWSKRKNEVALSDSLEGLQEGEEEEPLTEMMAEEIMALLEPTERRLLRLRFWQDLNWKELGTQFGISSTTAKARYEKILAKLRRRIGT